MRKWVAGLLALGMLAVAGASFTQERELDPLLKILVQNKVITLEQAQAVQAEYDRQKATEAPVSGAVTKDEAQKIAEEAVAKAKPNLGALDGLKVGGTWYLSYQNGDKFSSGSSSTDRTDAYNKFTLKRGYIDIQKSITPWLDARATPDLTQDSTGDFKLRLKYLYAKFKWKGTTAFSKPYLEVGLAHNPWLDFEESIDRYRMQDTMFLERNGIFASADVGLMFGTNFGGEMPKSYQDEIKNHHYGGRYGSMQVGIYNGGGYHAAENNTDKVIMGRFTLRPMPDFLPGFQISVLGVDGKGNVGSSWVTTGTFAGTKNYPDWRFYDIFLSYEHPRFVLTAQYAKGRGNSGGSKIYSASDYVVGATDASEIYKAQSWAGYSFFGEYRFPERTHMSAFYRHDRFDPDTKGILQVKNNEDVQTRDIAGLAYWLYKNNAILFDYERLSHSRYFLAGTQTPDENRFQLTLQIKY